MASYTLKTPPTFPDGTTVGAYPAGSQTLASTGPLGSPVNEQVATAGQVTFTGLVYGEAYVAFGFVGGQWKRTGFSVDPPTADLLSYFTTTGTSQLTNLTAFGRSLIDDQDATAALGTLGLLDLIPTASEGGWDSDGQFFKKSGIAAPNSNVPASIVPVGAKVFRVDANGRIHMGENKYLHSDDALGSTMHNSAPDFLYDPGTQRVMLRTVVICEIGDAPEIQIRRAGPDNTYPGPSNGVLTGLLNGTTVGLISFYPFVTPTGGTPGTTRGFISNPAGGIYMQMAQDAFEGKVGGRMYFATTPIDGGNYVTRLVIDHNGHIYNGSGSDIAHFSITGRAGDESSPLVTFRGSDSATGDIFKVQFGGAHTNAIKVDSTGKVALSSLGVANSASASSLGSVARKMQVFDAAGTSLGYVPIYDAIT